MNYNQKVKMSVGYIRQCLQKCLGENYKDYVELVQDWLNNMITKDYYDTKIRTILSGEGITFHNEMIKLILRSCAQGESIYYSPQSSESYTYNDIGNQIQASSSASSSLSSSAITCSDVSSLLTCSLNIRNLDENEVIPIPSYTPIPDITVDEKEWSCPELQVNNVIPNVTHVYNYQYKIDSNPELKRYFKLREDSQVFSSTKATLLGRYYVVAWKYGIEKVEQEALETAFKECKERVKKIVTSLVHKRRGYVPCYKNNPLLVGLAYPNPYLRQGWHFYEQERNSVSAKIANASKQIPPLLRNQEDTERLIALQLAASYPSKPNTKWRKTNLHDLILTIEGNKRLIPNNNSRLKFIAKIMHKMEGVGVGEKEIIPKPKPIFDDDSDVEEENEMDQEEDEEYAQVCIY